MWWMWLSSAMLLFVGAHVRNRYAAQDRRLLQLLSACDVRFVFVFF